MKRRADVLRTVRYFLLPLLLSGCLSFGSDVETASPSPEQVARCVAEMYINPGVVIRPLGFKLLGSGIDDAIWFKFETTANVQSLFNLKIVDTSGFSESSNQAQDGQGPSWWDLSGKKLLGGQVQLPNARFMNVHIEKKGDRNIVYILWHET